MNNARLAPLIGIVGCALVLIGLAVPYALVETAAGTAVGTYYGTGAVNPFVAGLFALIGIIVLAAGREDRTDPGLAAGVALVLGVFIFALVALWALTVPEDVVVGMSENTAIEYHRWGLAGVSVLPPVASAWWARTLGFL